ncbi:Aste57867_12190 [Aphanomyces stellatus]|uniref:Aste57867_12190 protein n=1 Tax=Aphanomyces stellatus TaxID=120398 RepID=A0A485KUY2_9STRA|nr:hypothetical protein As57867_012145 [Aphanomyces stellatus]VFT89044.1 Aste57867_12190 [Aphanomyces stellatus]
MASKRAKKDDAKDGENKTKSKKKEKTPKEPKEPKTKAPPAPPETPPPAGPELNDPDAVQLFRRYDREKANHITRSDFLELLRDYTAWYPGRKWDMPVMPCALTDAAGIPLGFERTARNSEFEAGQLFERYDVNRSGTLEIKEFQVFYRDFKKQLAPFVEEMLSPRTSMYTPFGGRLGPYHMDTPAPWMSNHHPSRGGVNDTRHLYESKLAQLHNMCESTLVSQRALLHDKLEAMLGGHFGSGSMWGNPMTRSSSDGDYGRRDTVERLQRDIDAIDRISSEIKSRVYLGNRVTTQEMTQFLEEFPRMHNKMEELAARVYPNVAFKSDEREKLLKVKDQMIWGLLQERNELRRQRDAMDAQLRHVTELSAQEMRKWAKYVGNTAAFSIPFPRDV